MSENEGCLNPSYDKSLTVEERLGDFLGAYYINMNGVIPNDIPEITETHKQDVIKFVSGLFNDKDAEISALKREIERLQEGMKHQDGVSPLLCYSCGEIYLIPDFKKLNAELTAERKKVRMLSEALLKPWLEHRIDLACKLCFPTSEILKEGFLCAKHTAQATLEALSKAGVR